MVKPTNDVGAAPRPGATPASPLHLPAGPGRAPALDRTDRVPSTDHEREDPHDERSTRTRGAPDPGFRTGVVRGISHGLFGPPTAFAEAAAGLGVGLVRAYVYWSQVEPEEGHFDFAVVDGLLDDLDAHGMDVWLTVCSSSPWATRVPTTFQPQSPALDATRYGRFVQAVVRRCAGRVQYWQCNNEPSNTGLLWDGTAEEYVAQLRVFYDVVRHESPAADGRPRRVRLRLPVQ